MAEITFIHPVTGRKVILKEDGSAIDEDGNPVDIKDGKAAVELLNKQYEWIKKLNIGPQNTT